MWVLNLCAGLLFTLRSFSRLSYSSVIARWPATRAAMIASSSSVSDRSSSCLKTLSDLRFVNGESRNGQKEKLEVALILQVQKTADATGRLGIHRFT